jgi:hypothetical protein
MARSTIIYKAPQDVIGKHIQSNEWIMYRGALTIYDRTNSPIELKLKSEIYDSFLRTFMEDKKDFKGESISEVFGKVAKWYNKNGILFQN